METLKIKNSGSEVLLMQKCLVEHGYKVGALDGVYGAGTLIAVKKFQTDNKLKADGVVGPATWEALMQQPKEGAENVYPYYSQKDPTWSAEPYTSKGDRSQTIGNSGCGLLSMLMIILYLLGKLVSPVTLAKLSVAGGHRTPENGTNWSFFFAMAKKYGLTCYQTYSTDEVTVALRKGDAYVIANMGKGYFTKGGHYIALIGIIGENIIVHDPASVIRSSATIKLFKKESKTYFIFRKKATA